MAVFSKRSKAKLEGVHPNLVKVLNRAIEITKQDFSITEGVRTKSQQKRYYYQGKSKTMNSKHLVQADGYSHAVDVVPYPVSWKLDKFYPIAEAIKQAAEELNVKVRWGGSWSLLNGSKLSVEDMVGEYSNAKLKEGKKVFIDAPHFELIL